MEARPDLRPVVGQRNAQLVRGAGERLRLGPEIIQVAGQLARVKVLARALLAMPEVALMQGPLELVDGGAQDARREHARLSTHPPPAGKRLARHPHAMAW